MKDKFEVSMNLLHLEETIKEQKPYTIVSISTTGVDTISDKENLPIRVNMTQYEYNEEIKKHEKGISFDKFIQLPEDVVVSDEIFNGIDKEKYLKGENVLSKEAFKKEFDLFCNALKQSDSVLIINEVAEERNSPCYTEKFKIGKYKDMSPAQVENSEILKKEKAYLSQNVEKYPSNKKLIDAIDDYFDKVTKGTLSADTSTIEYLDKIECGDKLREFEKEDKVILQKNLTQEYFKKNKIEKGATFENLRDSLLTSPKGSFYKNEELKNLVIKTSSYTEFAKELAILKHEQEGCQVINSDEVEDVYTESNLPTISEQAYNATKKEIEVKNKKIVDLDSQTKVINTFIEKYGREVGVMEDELQSHFRENERGMAESYSKKGKEDYNKSSFSSKFDFFIEKGIIKPEVLQEGKGEFQKLVDTIEGKKGHKGIVIAHASSTGFEKGVGAPQNVGQPIQFTAMAYQIKDGKPDFSKENVKNKYINMNIQASELAVKKAEERKDFDVFKDAGIDLEKYKNKEGVLTQNKAINTIDTFFKTYPLEDYALIFLDSAGAKGQSFTQTCMSNLANFPMCNKKDFIDMSQVIKEYAFLTCKEHETEYANKNILFNEETMKDKNFGIKAIAEANNIKDFYGSAKKCYFVGNIIKAFEQQQVELFRPEELPKEKTEEVNKKGNEKNEKFIDEGYDNVSPDSKGQIDKAEQRRIEREAQNQMIEQNIDAISDKPFIPSEKSFREFEKNIKNDEDKRQTPERKDNTIPFEKKPPSERPSYQREPQRETKQTTDSGLDANRLVEVILKQNEMISEQSRTISELNSKMFDVLAQQNEVMRAFVERAGNLHKAEPVHEVQQEKKVDFDYTVKNNEITITRHIEEVEGEIIIPSKIKGLPVTSIGEGVFEECTNLKSIVLPDTLTSIGKGAFYDCRSLTSITIPNSVQNIGEGAFEECTRLKSIKLPDTLTSIGKETFKFCTRLTSIDIPNSVTSIGESAFEECTSLRTINIPDSVTQIGNFAFQNCDNLSSIEIPKSVTSIGEGAFLGCIGLTSIIIPDTVKNIDEGAFSGCESLVSIKIPDSLTEIKNYTFRCTDLTSLTIPKSVTSIGEYTFEDCRELTSINIPDSVTSIGKGAFERCTGLTSITIPDSVTRIGDSCFSKCNNLKEIVISENLYNENPYAFDCSVKDCKIIFAKDDFTKKPQKERIV